VNEHTYIAEIRLQRRTGLTANTHMEVKQELYKQANKQTNTVIINILHMFYTVMS